MTGGVRQQRTQALAAAQCGIAHGTVQFDRGQIFGWQYFGQRTVGAGNQGPQCGTKLRLRA
jgi:hypothetical protein